MKTTRVSSSGTANVCCNMIVKCLFCYTDTFEVLSLSVGLFSGDDDIELNREIFNSLS